ncbi:MAG: hypothetical protein KIS81_12225 [Maricaulaceae bacterium]|nr:hypothetical protein [Maricaulaceae bacterium]
MKLHALLAAGLLIGVSACATTNGQTSAPAAEAAPVRTAEADPAADRDYDPDRIRCENQQVLGSRLPARRVCRTEAEWRALREGSQEAVREIQRMPIPETSN